jgi:hypothetical protein
MQIRCGHDATQRSGSGRGGHGGAG